MEERDVADSYPTPDRTSDSVGAPSPYPSVTPRARTGRAATLSSSASPPSSSTAAAAAHPSADGQRDRSVGDVARHRLATSAEEESEESSAALYSSSLVTAMSPTSWAATTLTPLTTPGSSIAHTRPGTAAASVTFLPTAAALQSPSGAERQRGVGPSPINRSRLSGVRDDGKKAGEEACDEGRQEVGADSDLVDSTNNSASPRVAKDARAHLRSGHSSANRGGEEAEGGGRRGACRITAKQWTAVATWSWSVQADTCAICKNALADVCVDCQTRPTPLSSSSLHTNPGGSPAPQTLPPSCSPGVPSPIDLCTLSWGYCSHVFHSHCISRWLAERRVCPLCGRGWELHKITKND